MNRASEWAGARRRSEDTRPTPPRPEPIIPRAWLDGYLRIYGGEA